MSALFFLAGFLMPQIFVSAKEALMVQSVPFSSQAPYGDWKDPRQQDGCEEASAMMAIRWVQGRTLSKKAALDEILKISAFEEKKYGSYHDTSASSTVERIFRGYFKYPWAEAKYGISLEDMKHELKKGNLLIVPANGRALGNPNFTPPGPDRHNLLIKGYDSVKKEFITNDPGTRKGEGFRYNEKILYNAIRDYPTGNHLPIKGVIKAMIIVRK
jgi:hypothetical protein